MMSGIMNIDRETIRKTVTQDLHMTIVCENVVPKEPDMRTKSEHEKHLLWHHGKFHRRS